MDSRDDHVLKSDVDEKFICTENQLADIFTKALHFERFSTLKSYLGVIRA